MRLPPPRGPLSAHLDALLRGEETSTIPGTPQAADVLGDEDLQLALYVSYELHYRGFDEIDPELEWDPAVISLRRS
ncbi:MAG: iron-containing redox enzyme family protein, partial [Actinomycetota bacterium]|nr:iron-containing redox enzyme family protein [Actinomycetota bacterium]